MAGAYERVGNSDLYIDYKSNLGNEKHGQRVYVGLYSEQNDKEKEKVAVKKLQTGDLAEAARAKDLSPHDNLVTYYTHFIYRADLYLVIELCRSKTLYELIERNPDLTMSAKRKIMVQVSHGIKHIHEKRYLHRDIKPRNMLLDYSGRKIKICDFGLSKSIPQDSDLSVTCPVSMTSTVIGTPGWMSPEATKGGIMSPESDTYSLGLVFLYIINGKKHKSNIIDWEQLRKCDFETQYCKRKCEHLLKEMLEEERMNRPKLRRVLQHPFFWSNNTEVAFLKNLVTVKNALLKGISQNQSLQSDWNKKLQAVDRITEENLEYLKQLAKSLTIEASPTEQLHSLMAYCFQNAGTNSIFDNEYKVAEYFYSNFEELVTMQLRAFDEVEKIPESDGSEALEFLSKFASCEDLIPEPGKVEDFEKSPSNGKVTLSWKAPAEIIKSIVVKIFYGEEEVEKREIPSDVTTFTCYICEENEDEELLCCDSTHNVLLKPMADCRIVINARNWDNMDGEFSDIQFMTPPYAPRNLKSEQQDHEICMKWDPMESNGHKIRYVIEVKLFKDDTNIPENKYELKTEETSFSISPIRPSMQYELSVYGKNEKGLAGMMATTIVRTDPPRLTNVKARILIEEKYILVSWHKPKDTSIKHFNCEIFMNGKFLSKRTSEQTDQDFFKYPQYDSSTEYYFEVWVTNKFGEDGDKARSNIVYTNPDKISDADYMKDNPRFLLTWKSEEDSHLVTVLCNGEQVRDPEVVGEKRYEFHPPELHQVYFVEVRARNKRGNDSEPHLFGPLNFGPPPVVNLDAKLRGYDIELSWENEDSRSQDVTYQIEFFENGSRCRLESSDSLSYTVHGIRPKTNYFFRVAAKDRNGVKSEPVQTNTINNNNVMQFDDLKAKENDLGILLTWESPWNSGVEFHIRCNYGEKSIKDSTGKSCFQANMELNASSEYQFSVKAISLYGDDILAVGEVILTTAPRQITNFVAHVYGNIIAMHWDPQDRVNMYRIEVIQDGKHSDTIRVAQSQYWFNANAESKYCVRVTPINYKSKEGPTYESEPIVCKRFHGILEAPTKVTFTKENDKILLTWDSVITADHFCIQSPAIENGETIETSDSHFELPGNIDTKQKVYVWAVKDGKGGRVSEIPLENIHLAPSSTEATDIAGEETVDAQSETPLISWANQGRRSWRRRVFRCCRRPSSPLEEPYSTEYVPRDNESAVFLLQFSDVRW